MDGDEVSPLRAGRFGSLRDFVLVERPGVPASAMLLVDKFEVTQGDWRSFARSEAGRRVGADQLSLPGEATLPVAGVDLHAARAFADWRCARLPADSDWKLVASGEGRSMFPWGSLRDPSRANTGDLGIGAVTPVGTFESGRRAGSDAPYDLIGNVSEWTETVPWRWCDWRAEVPLTFARSLSTVRSTPAVALWSLLPGVVPSGLIAAAGGGDVPHLVVGSDFRSPMVELYAEQYASERRDRTGLRIYATVGELVDRLSREPGPENDGERLQLRRFALRGRNREVLRSVLAARPAPPAGSAADELRRAIETPNER